jgi:hypothetical protein
MNKLIWKVTSPVIIFCMCLYLGYYVTSCEVHKVYRYDTLKVYDTVIIYRPVNEIIYWYDTIPVYDTLWTVAIKDCANYIVSITDLDSSSRVELQKILNEFIRKSKLWP